MPVVMSVRSRIVCSALRRGRIARFGCRGRKRLHVGYAVVICHDGSLGFVGDGGFGNPRYAFEALLDDERAIRAVHILHSQRGGLFSRQCRGCTKNVEGNGRSAEKSAHNVLRSRVEEQGRNEVKAKGGNDKDRCENESGLGQRVWQRTRAGLAVGASNLRGSIDEPIAVAEEANCRCDEIGLIRCKLRKIADPRSAHPEPKQNQWQNTAGRGRERSEKATGRRQPLPALQTSNLIFLIDRHGLKMHPVAATGSKTFSCVESRLREPKISRSGSFQSAAV